MSPELHGARTILALLCLAALAGCSRAAPGEPPAGEEGQAPGTHREYRMQHGGLERNWLLYVPKGCDGVKPLPLVVALHGGGGSAEKWTTYTDNGFEKLADRDGFLVAYPNGIENQWNDKRGVQRFRAQREDVNDAGFLSALIDLVKAERPVDARRVYLTGASNGGMMANYAGAELSGKVAAIAPVIASIPENLDGKLKPGEPISVLMINGTEDPLVRWEGGEVKLGRKENGRTIPVEKTVEFWVRATGSAEKPTVEELPDADPEDGTRVTRFTYAGGRAGTEVVFFYKVVGGGHHWPATQDPRRGRLVKWVVDGTIGRKSRDIDACEVIWEFFKAHPKAGAEQRP